MTPLSPDEEYHMIQNMLTSGGSFVKCLAECFQRADADNRRRLYTAFPEYVEQYRARMIVPVILTEQERLDILTNAIDTGAIGYWACEYGPVEVERNNNGDVKRARFYADDVHGNKIMCDVSLETIQVGVERIFSDGFAISDQLKGWIATKNNDADTDDAIVQAGVFGELVYG